MKLRIANALIPGVHKLRIANALVTGAGTNPKLRIANALVTGVTNLTLLPMADQSVEAFDVVNVSVSPASSSPTPSAYGWRQISGPAVSVVSDSGPTAHFIAPPAIPGATVVLGVIASLGGVASPEVTVTINVAPHIFWVAGSSWNPLSKTGTA